MLDGLGSVTGTLDAAGGEAVFYGGLMDSGARLVGTTGALIVAYSTTGVMAADRGAMVYARAKLLMVELAVAIGGALNSLRTTCENR
ncbi:hypothetical protein [Nocardioides jishulii]|uniref:Uncharacterized protein n=1 Tax=Nocardioides jishulii TaxID=2575440 RepID=A0A4U2YTU9_9ACTN|nr:hypothetical protein [Nocardioides jishulii]QCX28977.1 hypothetical protein FCL41_16710 [Nocardioides jishulii]TKI64122.1 hypothetical protein FC770_02855 [Nocardioides jishulii]